MLKKMIAAGTLFLALGMVGLQAQFGSSGLEGEWRGTRSERNPITGQTFTIAFAMNLQNNGVYQYVAKIGSLTILKVAGRYSVRPGSKPGNPSFTHILALSPVQVVQEPTLDELRLLQIADLPNIQSIEEYIQLYNLAPAGGLTLQNRDGGESWGMQRVR